MKGLFGWKAFNDRLALLVLIGIPVLWLLDAKGWVTLDPQVMGALILTWGIVIQYYFRRAPPDTDGPPAPPKPPGG
mgnify:FL=1